MSNRIICLFLAVAIVTVTAAESRIGRTFKQWVGRTFGINAEEKYTGQKFNPTISNLNTVILQPCTHAKEVPQESCFGVSELAQMIDQKCLPQEAYLECMHTDKHNSFWQVHTGLNTLDSDETIFVYSRGFAGADKPADNNSNANKPRSMCGIPKQGGGMVVGSQWLKNGVINSSCVIFDYPDKRDTFDFGLTHDRECLKVIHTKLLEKTDNIVFFGNCRGSKALINYLCKEQPESVKAVILEAPLLDLNRFVGEIERNYGKHIPFVRNIAKKIITKWFPCYDAQQDLKLADLQYIPTHIPIFIAHLKGDTLVSDQTIKDIVKTLRDSGHTVYLLVIDDKTKSHSRLYQTSSFAKATNAFLKKHGLPHDAKLAEEGRTLLCRAKANARDIDKWPHGFIYVYKEA